MGAWGFGLFQSDHDYDIVDMLTDEAGLAKAEQLLLAAEPDTTGGDKHDRVHLSIFGDHCTHKVEARDHLETDARLVNLFTLKERVMDSPDSPDFPHHPTYVFCLLGACAMTLGCKIPLHFKKRMQNCFLECGMMELAERQMFKALNGPDGYEAGVPYDFESLGLIATANIETPGPPNAAGFELMNVPSPGGLIPGPPKNKTARMLMTEGRFGAEQCGHCGNASSSDAMLLQCARCKMRKYCGKECQLKHWKAHKNICKRVKDVAG